MKKLTIIFWVSLGCFLSACSIRNPKSVSVAPSVAKLNADILAGPGTCLVQQFQGASSDNLYYVNWIYYSDSEDYYFQIDKSADGKNFEPFYTSKGERTPGKNGLSVTVIDSIPSNREQRYFRLKALRYGINYTTNLQKMYKGLYDNCTIMVRANVVPKEYDLSDHSILTENSNKK